MSVTSVPTNLPFPSSTEFTNLKKELGQLAYLNVVSSMGEFTYGTDSKNGAQCFDSKKVIKAKLILDKKTNVTASMEFYADKFLSNNLPDDYEEILKDYLNTKTKKAAFNIIFKICIEAFKQDELDSSLLKKSENIKDLKDSAVLKVATCTILQHCLLENEDHPERAHLCDDRFFKKWS